VLVEKRPTEHDVTVARYVPVVRRQGCAGKGVRR
jgi:hypothetical protein